MYLTLGRSHLIVTSVAILYILSINPLQVESIRCYQCNYSHIDCGEEFDEQNANLHPEDCSHVFEAQYCIKTTGIYEGQIGTKRFCSSRDHGNYCEYVTRSSDSRPYRSCFYTCATDGCNAAQPTGGILPAGGALLARALVLLTASLLYHQHLQ